MACRTNNSRSGDVQVDSGAALRSAPATNGLGLFARLGLRPKLWYPHWRASRQWHPKLSDLWHRALHRDVAGTTTLEFALCIPFLLFIALLLIQSTLVAAGHLMVRYAAFAATRSAIVTIPADFADATPSEPSNFIECPDAYDDPASFTGKYRDIRDAAVYAIAPVAAPDGTMSASGTTYPINSWPSRAKRLPSRLQYAGNKTYVQIFTTTIDDDHPPMPEDHLLRGYSQVGPRDAITVRVMHDFKLTIPVAKRVFADDDSEGTTQLSAQFTLNNEGVTHLLPPIPRDTGPDKGQNGRRREPRLFGD